MPFLIPLIAIIALSVYGGEAPVDSVPFAGRVTVRAEREERLLSSPESKAVITPDAWEGTGKTLADVLVEQAGVETRRYGGLGSFQTVSIRGVPGSHILVFLDDLPLNSAGGGPVDLSKLDLQSIERIEVIKGITPARFGGNGLGGVIQLVTRRSASTAPVKLSSLSGSHGTEKHSASAEFPLSDAFRFSTALAYEYSRNDFEFLNRNNTPYNKSDDRWMTRKNSDYRSFEGLYRATGDGWRGLLWDLSLHHTGNRGGLPGTEAQQTKTSGFENSGHQVAAALRWPLPPDSPWRLRTVAAWEEERPRYFWSRDDGIGLTTSGGFVDLGSVNTKWSGKVETAYASGEKFRVESYLTGVSENLIPVDYLGTNQMTAWENRRRSVNFSADAVIGPFGSLSFTGGYSSEISQDHTEGGLSYYGVHVPPSEAFRFFQAGRVGVNWRPSSSFLFYSNAAKYYRAPSLLEQYGGRNGVLPNPDLKPETGMSGEGGAKWDFGKGFFESVVFLTRNEEVIVYIQSANLMKPGNLETAQTMGVEVSGHWRPLNRLNLSGNATFQDPRIVKGAYAYDGNLIPNEPVFSTSGKCGVGPFARTSLYYTISAQSGVFRDYSNIPPGIPPQILHGVSVHFAPFADAKIYVNVENITAVFYEEAYASYPYPGRQYFAGFTFGFNPK